MPDLTPQTLDFSLGNGCYMDVLAHSGGGPKPVLILRHGGGGTGGDRRYFWCDGKSLNRLCWYLSTSIVTNFDIVSLGTPQWAFDSPTSAPHLASIVNCPTGSKFPESYDLIATAVAAVIANLSPSKVFLGGTSFGAMMTGCAMMRSSLPIDGLFTQFLCPDVRHVGGDSHVACRCPDTIHQSWLGGIDGHTTQAQWNATQNHIKRSTSFLWYLERGLTTNKRPMFVSFDVVGDGIKPYGDPARVGSGVHDGQQYPTLTTALTAAGVTHTDLQLPSRDAWEINTFGDPANIVAENWLLSLL